MSDCLSLDLVKEFLDHQKKVLAALARVEAQERNNQPILEALARIEAQGVNFMAVFADVKAAIDAVNQHTNDLSVKVDGVVTAINQIIADLKAGAGDPVALQAAVDELGTVGTNLDTISTHLDAMGKDPTNPLPPAPALAKSVKRR